MIDQLMIETQANRIQELTEQLYAEIEGAVETMKAEHSKVTYSKNELLLLYTNKVAANLQTRASMRVEAERNREAITQSLQLQ